MTTLHRSFVPDAPPVLPNASRIGLIVFMAVATTLFSLLLFAYAMRMREPDWQPIPHPALLWWNTGALVLASIAMQRARQLTSLHRAAWLVSSGVLAAVFVIGQLTAWRMLSAAGQTVTANPSNSFLYLLTGLHGLHVLGGLVAWAVTIARLQRGDPFRTQRAISLCAIYWHFLLAVWLVLLAAMWWITPGLVAAICGPLYGAAP